MKRRARERQEKRENSQPTLKKLHAALLRSFKRQHGEKNSCVRRVPGVTGDPPEGQQPFRPNPNWVGDRTITLRRLLVRAVQFCSLDILYIRVFYNFTTFDFSNRYQFF